MKVKVIDALSCGTPVVGTDVAFEGIEDNAVHRLFFRAESAEEFAAVLNGWRTVSQEEKQRAADEFFLQYDKNHFLDIL